MTDNKIKKPTGLTGFKEIGNRNKKEIKEKESTGITQMISISPKFDKKIIANISIDPRLWLKIKDLHKKKKTKSLSYLVENLLLNSLGDRLDDFYKDPSKK